MFLPSVVLSCADAEASVACGISPLIEKVLGYRNVTFRSGAHQWGHIHATFFEWIDPRTGFNKQANHMEVSGISCEGECVPTILVPNVYVDAFGEEVAHE